MRMRRRHFTPQQSYKAEGLGDLRRLKHLLFGDWIAQMGLGVSRRHCVALDGHVRHRAL